MEIEALKTSIEKLRRRELYTLNTSVGYFLSGETEQNYWILGSMLATSLILKFSKSGDFLSIEIENESLDITSPKLVETLDLKIGPIKIRKFYLEDYSIGIKDLPKMYEEYLAREDMLFEDQEEEEEFIECLKDWIQKEMYEFWWAKEYWIDHSGEIESS